MDDDRIELVTRLFALATEIAEAPHETSILGQASSASPADPARGAEALCLRAERLKTIDRTIALAVGHEALTPAGERSFAKPLDFPGAASLAWRQQGTGRPASGYRRPTRPRSSSAKGDGGRGFGW